MDDNGGSRLCGSVFGFICKLIAVQIGTDDVEILKNVIEAVEMCIVLLKVADFFTKFAARLDL